MEPMSPDAETSKALPRAARAFCAALACAAFTPPLLAQTTREPLAVIDTTGGRLRCTLLTRERPLTTARFLALARGTAPWTDPGGATVENKPFYDGTRLFPTAAGIMGGTRSLPGEQPAAAAIPVELDPPLLFDRPGRLAMLLSGGKAGPSRFLITDHANAEEDGAAVIFGQCDGAGSRLVADARRALQATDNHPAAPFAVNHIAIVPAGSALPPPAPPVSAAAIAPGAGAPPAALSGPEPTGPRIQILTSKGTIHCRLFTRESPIATSVFLGLADGTHDWTDPRMHTVERRHPFYDGMPFDRVLPDFYIQFGDIAGDISGKTDIGFRFRNENTPGLSFDRPGRLAFGNAGPDTNSSEIFFSLNPMHRLDGGFPIIGQCDAAGLRVLERIAKLPRDAKNRPVTPVIIRSIRVVP